jgi:hypothetical protein
MERVELRMYRVDHKIRGSTELPCKLSILILKSFKKSGEPSRNKIVELLTVNNFVNEWITTFLLETA